MFGLGRLRQDLDALTERCKRLEAEVDERVAERVQHEVAALRAEMLATVQGALVELGARLQGDPERRAQAVLAAASEELRVQLQRAIGDTQVASERATQAQQASKDIVALRARLQRPPAWQAPQPMPLDVVHHAPTNGFVALWFEGGYTGVVALLVGPADPPETCVGRLNTRNDLNPFCATVVRRGEYWKAQVEKGSPDLPCVYTPFG